MVARCRPRTIVSRVAKLAMITTDVTVAAADKLLVTTTAAAMPKTALMHWSLSSLPPEIRKVSSAMIPEMWMLITIVNHVVILSP